MNKISVKTLYEQDFALWIVDTVSKLKAEEFNQVDWDNLIEEIESLGKKDKRELKNRLTTLFEHALKLQYVPLPDFYRGWEVTIKRTQSQLRDILKDSPSLQNYLLEIYTDCYQEALENVQIEYDAPFPDICHFSSDIDSLLTKKNLQ
ncbi:DUF29 domain-containing protein [Calothrix sp. PCC 7507]|uniref:DUF29 domain-containing protein n=1 Tax=Calothrix sp. PCC 7507 TaxID=99598 RepID=UPI00029ED5FD|nr:DUF29 domain-containing protein [Calothrix sp. PCC 7507]AFY35749.1 protein of unknown function DUF29 [Calothrix sp. PCC 7507]